jgi:hypothetical protein
MTLPWPLTGFARSLAAALVVVLVAACSPALDWRDFVPEGSGIHVSFPCRPDRVARPVVLAGFAVTMELLSCSASDGPQRSTFALAFVDLTDPARVDATLLAWRAIALANVNGQQPQALPLLLKGMTANAQAGRLLVNGHLPDGAAMQEHVAFFVHGLRLYQATVLGTQPSAQAVDGFFGGLRFPS